MWRACGQTSSQHASPAHSLRQAPAALVQQGQAAGQAAGPAAGVAAAAAAQSPWQEDGLDKQSSQCGGGQAAGVLAPMRPAGGRGRHRWVQWGRKLGVARPHPSVSPNDRLQRQQQQQRQRLQHRAARLWQHASSPLQALLPQPCASLLRPAGPPTRLGQWHSRWQCSSSKGNRRWMAQCSCWKRTTASLLDWMQLLPSRHSSSSSAEQPCRRLEPSRHSSLHWCVALCALPPRPLLPASVAPSPQPYHCGSSAERHWERRGRPLRQRPHC